jgi:hypothetical protein
VIDGGDRASFLPKTLQPIRIGGDGRGKQLDRDLALQPRIVRAIDLSHATRAEQRLDLVRPDATPGRQ